MKQIFRLLALCLVFAACKEVYDRPPQSRVQVNLYGYETKKAGTYLVSVHGINRDSLIADARRTNQLLLPLDQSGSLTFALLIDSVADTITINYESKLAYESMESGFYTEHQLLSVQNSRNKIDSISMVDTLIISTWHENIQLYLNDSTAFTGAN